MILEFEDVLSSEQCKEFIQKYGAIKGFDFQEDAYYGKVEGLLTHTNVRKDKWDCYPHPDFVDMIMSL